LALKYKVNLEGNMDRLSLQVLLLPSFSPSSLFVVAKIHRVLSMHFCILLDQWCTNLAHNHASMSKLCVVMPNVCGSPVQNVCYVTLLASRILKWLLDFWKICASRCWSHFVR